MPVEREPLPVVQPPITSSWRAEFLTFSQPPLRPPGV